jgi:Fe-Mn family superoxide dismutase
MNPYSPRNVVPKTYREQTFDLHDLDGISDAQIQEHLALYAGYVKQVNMLNEEISGIVGRGQAAVRNPEFSDLTRHLGFEYNGMILHEHYFANLGRAAEPAPPAGSDVAAALIGSFGSVEQWQAAFQAIGAMRGIGWVVLFQDPVTDGLTNHWIDLHHQGVPAGFRPLLVMDVWEHAFMRDYKASEREKYIEAFFRNIDWQMVGRRHHEATSLRLAG